MEESTTAKKTSTFWRWAPASIIFRLVLIYFFPTNLILSSRPEVSTPVTSLRRTAEGYWLNQASISSYAGSMYHGSPLLLSVLGPLVVNRSYTYSSNWPEVAFRRNLKSLGLGRTLENSEIVSSGDIAGIVYCGILSPSSPDISYLSQICTTSAPTSGSHLCVFTHNSSGL